MTTYWDAVIELRAKHSGLAKGVWGNASLENV